MLSVIRKIFGPGERISELTKEIEEHKHSINKFLSKNNPMLVPYCALRQTACVSCGLLYWEKDKDYRYIVANETHCNVFFNISYKDVNTIIGKTDIELITEFRKHGSHTFGELCVSSDNYIKQIYEQKHNIKPIRFFEFGYKNNLPLLLDVTKEAIINKEGMFIGIKGYALDLSTRSEEAIILLNSLFNKGIITRIDKSKNQTIACYLFNERKIKQKKLQFPY